MYTLLHPSSFPTIAGDILHDGSFNAHAAQEVFSLPHSINNIFFFTIVFSDILFNSSF